MGGPEGGWDEGRHLRAQAERGQKVVAGAGERGQQPAWQAGGTSGGRGLPANWPGSRIWISFPRQSGPPLKGLHRGSTMCVVRDAGGMALELQTSGKVLAQEKPGGRSKGLGQAGMRRQTEARGRRGG